MRRVVMLVDLDYFFAQAEEIRNPSIKTKPVVVCVYSGRTVDSGAVSTANYVARKYGVKSGMPIFMAKNKLENVDAVFLPVDHDYYQQISDRIMTLLRGQADIFEQVGIDEAYLDVSRRAEGDFEKAKPLAHGTKQEIQTDERLTCSIGIGPNKLVAKIAADSQKPDGLTIVSPEQARDFLATLSVSSLIGVGKKTEKRMVSLGIRTVGDLANFDIKTLEGVFGKTLGNYFHNASLGIDEEPVKEASEAESISRIATLKDNTRDLQTIFDRAYLLCTDVYADLVRRGVGFQSVSILAVMADMSVLSRSTTLEESTRELETLTTCVKELLARLLRESNCPLRRIGVKIAGLSHAKPKQGRLTKFL
jgi:DNA polymerase IV (DinB-like DNA polymerase)